MKYRINLRKNAQHTLKELIKSNGNLLIIHYSCESFYDIPNGRSPRITSIAIRYFKSGQTKSFSIHKMAEINKIKFEDIEENYDILEKKMLDDYFEFIKIHIEYNWVHWNMRDSNYGFEAIEYRYTVLGGFPVVINNKNKFDLANILIDLYGPKYISHPRLENLIKLNKISTQNFLSGKEEAECFTKKEFVKLHQSTLRKVDIFQTLIDRELNNELRNYSKFIDIYGLTPQSVFLFIQSNWLANLVYSIVLIILGAFIGQAIGS